MKLDTALAVLMVMLWLGVLLAVACLAWPLAFASLRELTVLLQVIGLVGSAWLLWITR